MSIYAIPVYARDAEIDTRQSDVLPPLSKPGESRVNAISPLFIPTLITPLPADEGELLGGINLAMTLDQASDGTGLIGPVGVAAYIDPWLAMQEGDKYVVWAHYLDSDTPIKLVENVVDAGQIDQRITLRLPGGLLREGSCEIYLAITRLSSGPGDDFAEESPRFTVLIRKLLPGGPDPDPDAPYHQNLAPPTVSADVLKNGVTKDYLDTDADGSGGVPVTIAAYDNMRKNDVITLFWGGVKAGEHTVLQAEAGEAYVFTVLRDFIENTGDSLSMQIYYSVRDVVFNAAAHNDSARLSLKVNTQLNLLPPPIIDQSDENNVINLESLAGGDVKITTPSGNPPFAAGDLLTLFWLGRGPFGNVVDHTESFKILANSRTHDFYVPYAIAHLIAHGQALVWFTSTRGTFVRESRRVCVSIEGRALLLPPPQVLEAAGAVLPADMESAQVRVLKIEGALARDTVRLYWKGTNVAGTPILDYITQRTLDAATVNQDIPFNIESQYIAPLNGCNLQVYYELHRDGASPLTSDNLHLVVGAAVGVLLEPRVPVAVNGVLDPAKVSNGTDAIIDVYPNMKALDHIVFNWVRPRPLLPWRYEVDLSIAAVGFEVKIPIPAEIIKADTGQNVTLVYTTTNVATKVLRRSKRLQLKIGAIIVPQITLVTGATGETIPHNSKTLSTSATLTGSAGANQKVEIRDHGNTLTTVTANANKVWTYKIPILAPGPHSFTVKTPGATQVSATWNITVLDIQIPVIVSAKDGTGTNLPNGASTINTAVSLSGTAQADQSVDLYLNNRKYVTVAVNSQGIWSYTFTPLAVLTHQILARPAGSTDPNSNSNVWVITVKSEWTDIKTTFHDYSYDGWITHFAHRSGSIRPWQGAPRYCNFTDQGPTNGFGGTIFYRDVVFPPGIYLFRMLASHIAEGYNPALVNPILGITEDGEYLEYNRTLPKNGVVYDFYVYLTVPTRRSRRLYVNNYQDGSNGNDFVIYEISITRPSGGGGGISSAPANFNELPPQEGPLPTIRMPIRTKEK